MLRQADTVRVKSLILEDIPLKEIMFAFLKLM